MKAAIEKMIVEMNEFEEKIFNEKTLPDLKSRFDEDHVNCILENKIGRYGYGVEFNRKYARVFKYDQDNDEYRSVVWFVNMETGHIYKANGWKSPSKYIRGHVSEWKEAMCQASKMGIYGFIAIR